MNFPCNHDMHLSVIKMRMAPLLLSPKGSNAFLMPYGERPRRRVQPYNYFVHALNAELWFQGGIHTGLPARFCACGGDEYRFVARSPWC